MIDINGDQPMNITFVDTNILLVNAYRKHITKFGDF